MQVIFLILLNCHFSEHRHRGWGVGRSDEQFYWSFNKLVEILRKSTNFSIPHPPPKNISFVKVFIHFITLPSTIVLSMPLLLMIHFTIWVWWLGKAICWQFFFYCLMHFKINSLLTYSSLILCMHFKIISKYHTASLYNTCLSIQCSGI